MWYSASLLLKRTHPKVPVGTDESLWEESIVLIEANCEAEARQQAEHLGRKENQRFQAVSGEEVRWDFVRITALYELLDDHVKNGTEVFSRFLRDEDVKILLAPSGSGNKPAVPRQR